MTVEELAAQCGLAPSRAPAWGWAAWRRPRGSPCGGCSTLRSAPPNNGAPGTSLARLHSYTLNRLRRERIEPVTAQDFMRFLLRWQHVAPGTRRQGRAGLLSVIEQLQGFELAAGAWEEAVLLWLRRRGLASSAGWRISACPER